LPAAGVVPTLSQVRRWTTAHLTDAADHWTNTATMWQDHFGDLADQISAPGGTAWLGDAADAAYRRAHTDRLTVGGQADMLHEAARIARSGAEEITVAREAVLKLVDAAESAGFVVGETFSVQKPGVYHPAAAAILQTQCQVIAAELRTAVRALVTTDQGVATTLTTATAGLGTAVFPEPGGVAGDDIRKFSGDVSQSPGSKDLPHGKDPRYWLDLDKVIRVGPGQQAPYGTTQIGPGLYYPDPGFPGAGPPGAAKHPLDVADVVTTAPGGLGPNGYEQISPGQWVPSTKGVGGAQPWPAPQQPIDVRDIIKVPPGQLAPAGYIQYLPGFWAPDTTLGSGPR
jgi:hypothetical protein